MSLLVPTEVPGLVHVPRWLDPHAQSALLASVDACGWSDALRRRVQHHGWRYDYRARRVLAGDRIGPLPDWLAPVAGRLAAEGRFERRPDQAIVNEYEPGQGIAAHVDCEPCFGGTIASVSLAAPATMELREIGGAGRHAVDLWPGDLLVLWGAARHGWTHAIPARRTDRVGGVRRPRGRRVSVTFRTVIAPAA